MSNPLDDPGNQPNYLTIKEILRDIIYNDHFGGDIPEKIVDQWVMALEPTAQLPLPPNVKGFYGGSLRASMPIEIARGSYKYIAHETTDREKIDKYARRMLISLSLLDVDALSHEEPILGALALWHQALAQVRLPEYAQSLRKTVSKYEEVRPETKMPDSKLPQPERLKEKLIIVASDVDNEPALTLLRKWNPM